ncbi:MAG: hypothetical protein HY074_08175 [Deltaproteobacteria bacterium]|nr:hypothetical protein [Deltaproteobacteria bacterium]
MIKYSGKASKSGGPVEDIAAEPMKDMYSGPSEVKAVGANGIREKSGLDSLPSKDLPDLQMTPMDSLLESADNTDAGNKASASGTKPKTKAKSDEGM